jgi:hypothetical protein
VSILPHIPAVEAVLEDEDEAGEEGVNVVEVEIDEAPEPLERRAS